MASIVPMLLDIASTPATVRLRVGWSTSSLNEVPPRGSRFGTISCVVGWMTPSSIAADIDMTLPVEPGS